MLLTRKSTSVSAAQGRLTRSVSGMLGRTIDRRTFLQRSGVALGAGAVASQLPLQVPSHCTLASAAISQVPSHSPSQLPSAWMPVPPPMAPAVQVPSHLPWQATVAPAAAVQLPEHEPEHEPEHLIEGASALASQAPLQEKLSSPPSQVGGLASKSQEALASQLAWQSNLASAEIEHCGGS